MKIRLTKQLEGTIEIVDSEVGTEFRIVFPTRFEDPFENVNEEV